MDNIVHFSYLMGAQYMYMRYKMVKIVIFITNIITVVTAKVHCKYRLMKI